MYTERTYTPEQLTEAEALVEQHNANIPVNEKARQIIIDVTGRKGVYFTMWVFNPMPVRNPLIYGGNLSTDLLTAVKKVTTGRGLRVVIASDNNFNPNYPKSGLLNFGKHSGKSIPEVYETDPNWVLWFASRFEAKTKHAADLVEQAKTMAELHWQMVTEQNRETCTSQYIGTPKAKVELDLQVFNVQELTAEGWGYYDAPYQYWQYKCQDEAGNLVKFTSREPLTGEKLRVKASIKEHKEVVGKQWTILTRVKVA